MSDGRIEYEKSKDPSYRRNKLQEGYVSPEQAANKLKTSINMIASQGISKANNKTLVNPNTIAQQAVEELFKLGTGRDIPFVTAQKIGKSIERMDKKLWIEEVLKTISDIDNEVGITGVHASIRDWLTQVIP